MASFYKRGSLYLLLATLLIGTLWRGGYYWHGSTDLSEVSQWPNRVFIIMLLVSGIWELVVTITLKEKRTLSSPAGLLLLALTIYSFIGISWSVSASDTIRESLLLLGYSLALFSVRSQLLRWGRQILNLVASWFVYVAAFTSAWGIISYLYRIHPYMEVKDNLARAGATFEYSNALSCFCLMALPLVFALMEKEKPADRPLNVAAGTIIAATTIITFSRLGLVLLAAMFLFLLVLYRQRGMVLSIVVSIGLGVAAAVLAMITQEGGYSMIGLVAVIVVVAISYSMQMLIESVKDKRLLTGGVIAAVATGLLAALLSLGFSERVQNIITSRFGTEMNFESLFGHRLDVYRGAFDAFQARPAVGYGLGTFGEVYQDFAVTASPTIFAHNVVLQMAVDTGIIGIILFIPFLIYAVVLIVWNLFARTSLLLQSMTLPALVFLLYSMFDWEWYIPALTAWFMVMIASLETAGSLGEPVSEPQNPEPGSKQAADPKKRARRARSGNKAKGRAKGRRRSKA